MRTKIGDWVRVCWDQCPGADTPGWSARLSYGVYEVTEVISPKRIRVEGLPCEVKSWVRCADMKEHA